MRLLLLFALLGCSRAPSFVFENPGRSLGSRSGDPVASIRASGHVTVLVTEASGAGKDLFVQHSSGGDGYRRSDRLNAAPGEVVSHAEATPQLLPGPGMRLCALWLARPGGGEAGLRLRCSRDFGERWDEAVTVPTGKPPSFFGGTVSPAGKVVVAWLASGEGGLPGTARLWTAISADGRSFAAPRVVDSNLCPCCRPALASAPGALYVAYRNVDAQNVRDIVARRSADDGDTWSEPAAVSRDAWKIDGCPHSGPALAVDGERLAIAWLTEADGRARLFWSESRDGAKTFARRKPLGDGTLDPNHPSLTIHGGKLYAAYEARDGKEGNGWGAPRAWLEEAGSRAPRLVPESADVAYARVAALSPGALLLAWTQHEGEETHAQVTRVRLQ